jgi:prophage regulatory protein
VENQQAAQQKRIRRLPWVMEVTGYSKTSIYRLSKLNLFPKPVPLNDGGAVGWLEHEVNGFIESRVAAREAA